ncbi:MAG: hypothetical protein HZA14_09845 [Nitrospirae bacterium]|nr:hypothetical protein [Nitrospirota bacterium]
MVNLSNCEILDELKKLGIDSDLIEYINEYAAYCSCRESETDSPKDQDR